jgi:peroxiredoxin
MRLLTRGRVVALIIACAFLAINVVALRWSSHLFASKGPATLLRFGDRVPKLKGKSLKGGEAVELATKSPANLILYFAAAHPPGFSTELVTYAETLSKTHKKDGLAIAVVVQKEIPELKNLLTNQLINYDVLVDDAGELQQQLGLPDGEDGVFLFNQEGLCRFSTRRPVTANDLRQLVAMEVLKIDPFAVPIESENTLKDGKALGSLSLVDAQSMVPVRTDEIHSKAGVPTHYIFFTADCSICTLPRYLEEFKAFRANQLKSDDDAVLIFDFNFPRADVLDGLKTNNIRAAGYLAKEPLPRLEYTDQQYRMLERTVAVIETDSRRKVLEIYPLNTHLAKRNNSPQSQPDVTGAAYEEMFGHVPLSAYDVATYEGKYFLTDIDNNRLLVINNNMGVEREFGRIGSAPGRLFHPGYLDISGDGTVFVEDGGNERIVKFDQKGHYAGEFRVNAFQGMAVDTQNQLYLGQPEEGNLITVYSSTGTKLRSFGQLKKYSEIYGEANRDKDVLYRTALNRVRLATDRDGNLYVGFMIVPLIQKYSPDGTLVFERRLEGPEIDRLSEAIHKRRYIATKVDGVDVRIIALDPVIDPANGNIMVPLVDGSVYVADREGNKLSLLRPAWTNRGDGTFYPFIAGLGANGEFMVTPFPPKHWYRLTMPSAKEVSIAAK